jgi:caffeoyl-CoA O-methyltransferase
MNVDLLRVLGCLAAGLCWATTIARAEEPRANATLDTRVRAFLETHDWGHGDMNVPAGDGQRLHDLIVEHGYTRGLEIGTSTGHSTIWIAWAMSKTGGRLTTIEIDEGRHEEALANIAKAGLGDYVDARRADAHELVPALPGPFDFVFSDADKDWYKRYLIDVLPKLTVGGCFTAHNVRRRAWGGGIAEFVDHLESLPNLESTYDESGAGLSISFKRAAR